MKIWLVFAVIALVYPLHFALGETMDMGSTQMVISKLEKLLKSSIDEEEPTKLKLRLGDLYAERARLYEAAQNEVAAKQDRVRAITQYEEIDNNSYRSSGDNAEKSKLALQLIHLYNVTGQETKAQKKYEWILKNPASYNKEAISEAHLQIGESLLSKNKYNQAESHFLRAAEESSRRPYALLKLAWCDFYRGRTSSAIKTLNFLLKNTDISASFKEGASHDLASILATNKKVTNGDIESLFLLSPENFRFPNLTYLANELDRLGKKTQALVVLQFIDLKRGGQKGYPHHLELARIHYDLGQKAKVKKELALYFQGLKAEGCDEKSQDCANLKVRSKKIITDWATAEAEKPTLFLLNAFQTYLDAHFESDMAIWAAQTAKTLKKWNSAFEIYNRASQVSVDAKSKEAALSGLVDVAEASQDKKLKSSAYHSYLQELPNGTLAQKIKYQLAYSHIEQKEFSEAAAKFHALALDRSGTISIRQQAADMSLTALVSEKNNFKNNQRLIESWSREYASAFPEKASAYQSTSWKTMIDRQSHVINSSDSDKSDITATLSEMAAVNLKDASAVEKKTFLKNKIIAAEKIKDLVTTKVAARQYLELNNLTPDEKEFATSRLAWVEEMNLNFGEAFKLTKQLKMGSLSEDQRLQKLSLLASLAGQDSSAYDKAILQRSRSKAIRLGIIEKKIKLAQNKRVEFEKYERELSSSPLLYGDLALEAFAQFENGTPNWKFAEKILNRPKIRATPSLRTLSKILFLHKFEMAKSHFGSFSPLTEPLKTSLSKNIRGLQELNRWVKQAIKDKDATEQILTLTEVKVWNKNLSTAIAQRPIPKTLSKSQKEKYRELLANQALPYDRQSREAERTLKSLWKTVNVSDLETQGELLPKFLKLLLSQEVAHLAAAAKKSGMSEQSDLIDLHRHLVGKAIQLPLRDLEAAKAQVRSEPFNENRLAELRRLEFEAGRAVYVSYLDARLSQIRKETR